jgi:hypothetical protein
MKQNTVAILKNIKFIIHEYSSCNLDEANCKNSGFSLKYVTTNRFYPSKCFVHFMKP